MPEGERPVSETAGIKQASIVGSILLHQVEAYEDARRRAAGTASLPLEVRVREGVVKVGSLHGQLESRPANWLPSLELLGCEIDSSVVE
jgi:hypothetical protein